MKRIIFTLLVIIPLNLNAQWEILNEGIRGQINSIDFVNDNIGWIAGSNGTLLKTTDAGEKWHTININEDWNIYQIDFINDSIGWAAGRYLNPPVDSGIIIKTSDGGNNWLIQKHLTDNYFNSISAVNEDNVYVLTGDKIFKTTNSGEEWTEASPPLPNHYYYSSWFPNSDTGVVVGYYDGRGTILKTTDGGNTWEETIVNEFTEIRNLQFLDYNSSYFIASKDTMNCLCKTEDLFKSWKVLTKDDWISSYQFTDDKTVYAIFVDVDSLYNSNYYLKKSIDGGLNWPNVRSLNFSANRIYMNNINEGILLGSLYYGRSGKYPILYRSVDQWQNCEIKTFGYPITNICFVNNEKGFFAGGRHILHGPVEGEIFSTSNGGLTWEIELSVSGFCMRKCFFIDESVGYCLGGDAASTIYKTTNSGNSWAQIYECNADSTGSCFTGNDFFFKNEELGWAAGRNGDYATVYVTSNGGLSWDLVKKFPLLEYPQNDLNSICFSDTVGWVIGENGIIIKHTPQTGWVKQTSLTTLPLNKVFFSDINHGWIAGGYINTSDFQSILIRTSDGGDNWNKNTNLSYLINDLWFLDSRHGWAVGCDKAGKGEILETNDGGDNWTVTVNNLIGTLNSIFIKDNYGWAVGEYGLVLRNTDAGVTWVDNETGSIHPTEFNLEQNFPNPFNPKTVISYQLPLISKVTLKVYDLLGREVTTLVNEEKPAGEYEIEFDGKNLSSGIYFYQLKTGDYIATKKMVLLK